MHDTAEGVVWWGCDSAGLATGREMVPPPLDTRAIPKITNLGAGTSHDAGLAAR